ncbi:MAG: hypothetical protein ACRC8A_00650 [Microcoleaceae cyanobacterium]
MKSSNQVVNRIVASLAFSLGLGLMVWMPETSSQTNTQVAAKSGVPTVEIVRSQTVDPVTGSVISVSSLKRK